MATDYTYKLLFPGIYFVSQFYFIFTFWRPISRPTHEIPRLQNK